jgi:hypothetical protein
VGAQKCDGMGLKMFFFFFIIFIIEVVEGEGMDEEVRLSSYLSIEASPDSNTIAQVRSHCSFSSLQNFPWRSMAMAGGGGGTSVVKQTSL